MTMRKRTPFFMLKVPQRETKPRESGITIVSDKTIPFKTLEDHLEISSDIIDYAKFADHVGMVARFPESFVRRKLQLYKKYRISTFPGGVPFELAVLQNQVYNYLDRVKEIGFDGVEISEDVIEPLSKKARLDILKRAKDLRLEVFTEIGRKNLDKPFVLKDALKQIREDLEAGVEKIAVEASDVAQLKDTDPDTLFGLVKKGGLKNLIFEVGVKGWPDLAVWLIENFGPEVNLQNVYIDNVLEIEAMRRGMHRYVGYNFLFSQKGVY